MSECASCHKNKPSSVTICRKCLEKQDRDVRMAIEKARQEGWDESARIRKQANCPEHGWSCNRCDSCIAETREDERQKLKKRMRDFHIVIPLPHFRKRQKEGME